MIGKSEKLCLTLLLGIALTNFSNVEAFASNTLNQIDVRKNSSDGLEFTLYTSSPYADNVVVTKKSDNKYVILMPNVNGSSASKPDFSAIKDIITDIDVRAVNDESNGYAKVTVITNRPVDIKTNTLKSTAPTESQKEYRALIAQQQSKASTSKTSANTTANNNSTFKLPEIQPTKTATDIAASKPAPQSSKQTQNTPKQVSVPTATAKVAQNSTPVKKQEAKTIVPPSGTNPVKPVANKISEQPKVDIKSDTKTTVEQTAIKDPAPIQEPVIETNSEVENTTQPTPVQESTIPAEETMLVATTAQKGFTSQDFIDKITDIKNKFSGRIPESMPVTLALILIPLVCVMILFNIIKSSLQRSQMLKKVLMENMARRQNEPASYDNIINNENLSWQEKFQQYREITNEAEQAEANQPRYNFIAKPQSNAQINPISAVSGTGVYTKGVINKSNKNKTADNLERILQASPEIEKTEIANDIEESEFPTISDVIAEDNSIHHEMSKTIKFKAFEEKMVLEETQRNKKVKHRRIQLELPKEAPHVNLGYSQLHSNPRSFKNANLSVSDLIARSDKLLNNLPDENSNSANNFETVSVNEYLNLLDKEKARATSPLSNVVAEKLSKKQEKKNTQSVSSNTTTNPITSLRDETKEDYLSNLIIKSGFDIDNERGFYLVSMDGKSAVIGKVGEEIFVLKKFDRNINKPLQVRMDNPNVYMVKADNFKSLVEVRKNDMDVLIEL